MRRFRLRYYIREALLSFKRSGFMTAVSAGVIALAVMAVSFYWLGYRNVVALAEQLGGRVEVVVFFEDGLPISQAEKSADLMRALPGAKLVQLVSPDQAREEMEKDRELKRYFELLEDNPLPASARVVLENHTPELVRAFAAATARLPGVVSVEYGDKAAENFLNMLRAVRWFVTVSGAVFCLAALVIMNNVIRLTVFARREEISIMQLVGASPLFVRAPYVLEGCLTGLIGGTAAAGLFYGLGWLIAAHLRRELNLDLTGYMAVSMDPASIAAMVGLGILLGLGGSMAAVGKYLR